MCEQTEIDYLDGEVVWVKLGSCWWPGEVVAEDKLPPDVLPSFRKPPIACVKFFQEDAYEFVKNINNIYKYNCSRKNEFISKGLYLFRTRHGHMEKFPDDVIRAETLVGGDIEILSRDEFQEEKKESYAGLFGKKTPSSIKKGKSGKGQPADESPNISTPRRQMREKADYKVHILVQGSKPAPSIYTPCSEETPTPSTSGADATPGGDTPRLGSTTETEDIQPREEDKTNDIEKKETPKTPVPSTPLRSTQPSTVPSSSGIYACHACPFSTTRLNVLILHNKTHSVSFMPYTPSPVRKKPKSPVKSTPSSSKTPKPRKPRQEKTEKRPKKVQGKKRASDDKLENVDVKKTKTDEEIKSSLLADWDDDVDDDSNDESSTMVSVQSPEVPIGAESPAVPTPAELPSAQVPPEMSPVPDKKTNSSPSTEKPETASDSKYEFCEDEDWPEETDFGRKIPRVKNPIRTEDPKNMGIDEDDVAREVEALLNKTAVPELPSVPEPLRIEENFPEPSVVKSPDKSPEKALDKSITEVPPTKAIFKTKTFFRSRHSRSQDAIGKYVAEQLNAVERMDISESDINGSEAVSSPEARDSPPIEPVKVARLAPKIQLKKLKAEAAQLKLGIEQVFDPLAYNQVSNTGCITTEAIKESHTLDNNIKKDESDRLPQSQPVQDVLYPTQEIRPYSGEVHQSFHTEVHQEPFTDKDLSTQEETINIVIETSNLNEEEVPKSQLEKQVPMPEEETSNLEEESTKFEEEIVQRQEETTKLKDNINKLEQEISNNKEVIITSPVFEEEPSEFVKEAPKYSEEVQTTFENETSKLERDAPVLEEETAKYEVQTTIEYETEETAQQIRDSNDISKDKHLNQKSEEPEGGLPITTILHKPSLPEDDSSNSLNKHMTNTKTQDQVGVYMNESTASAVDALLSVSRETDRVPRVVSNDLPEDLFEDDKDSIECAPEVNNDCEEKMDINDSHSVENGLEEQMETEVIHEHVESTSEVQEHSENNYVETSAPEILHTEEITDLITEQITEEIVDSTTDVSKPLEHGDNNVENIPSESDLQVAEALINLPATGIQNTTPVEHKESLIIPFSFDHENGQEEIVPASENVLINDNEIGFLENEVETETVEHVHENVSDSDNLNARFETEQEKSENLNAAQSLVQMSESIEHKINIVEPMDTKDVTEPNTYTAKQNNGIDTSVNSVEQNVALLTNDNICLKETPKTNILSQSSSKLLKILEEPCKPKMAISKTPPTKQIATGKEKILNFDVAKSVFSKNKLPKQKIIIRRNPTSNKIAINKVTEMPSSDKIILSRSGNQAQESSAVKTFTIQTSPDAPSDANTIIIQQKIRKISKPAIIQPKLQKIKPQTSLVAPSNEVKTSNKTQANDDAMFDINSMPILLSEDLLTPESIEKMPVVMSDGNIITQPQTTTKVIKQKQNVIEQEKVVITSSPHKPEVKTLLLNPAPEVTKSATPNILSKSSKLRGAKPMLVIDKTTGKQKIIMTKSEQPVLKETKAIQPAIIQSASTAPKPEKFIILPTQAPPPRPTRTQKIVIDPQTGKAHMYVSKGSDLPSNASENKPVSAKLVPSSSDAASGNTVMIITNAQGAQSRIVLTPRHEKILFPNKQQPNVQQLKAITHRITQSSPVQKTLVTTTTPTIAPVKAPARIVPKQNKSAIITSKGQLIVGGRVASTAQNIAPMPELRPVQSKRIVTSEPKKLTTPVHKTNSEPIIFLQQKSGAVMQLTAAQFEHLQRTGQIVQKSAAPAQERVLIQKSKLASEPGTSAKRPRKPAASPTLLKRAKHEIAIAPAPAFSPAPAPALAPAVPVPSLVPAAPHVASLAAGSTASGFTDFDNFEELLPSTAIARQARSPAPPPLAPAPAPEPAAALSEQILAVPGEHLGALAGTFYLCVEENGSYTPIDNRPLVLENDQLVPAEAPPPERRDILEAALANSDVFRAEAARDEPPFRELAAACRVSETSSTLHQPIMSPAELPRRAAPPAPPAPASLEAGLAVIGVTPLAVPTSLELPITVTDPRIAPRAAPPPDLFPAPSISMPLLTDDEAVGGKSMPILTEEPAGGAGGWGRPRPAPSPERAHSAADLESRS